MPPFPGDPSLRQLLAVHSTRNGVPMEDRIRDGTGQPPVEEPEVSRETPPVQDVQEPDEPPPAAARRRR